MDNTVALYDDAYVETVEINGVDFSHPAGSFRLNGSRTFTHFATQVFTFFSSPQTMIYKITAVKWINATVVEYSYTLDILKMWWLWDGGSATGLSQSRLIRVWSSVVTDTDNASSNLLKMWLNDPDDKPMGGVDYRFGSGNSTTSNLWCLTLNTFSSSTTSGDYDTKRITTAYFLDYTGVHTLIYNLNTSQYAAAFYKQIAGFYKVPGAYVDGSGHFNVPVATTLTGINFVGLDENGQVVSANMTTGWRIGWSGSDPEPPYAVYDTGLSIRLSNYRDIYHTKYTLSVPYVGNVEVPTALLVKVARNQTSALTIDLYVKYYYDFIDGTFNICFDTPLRTAVNPTLTPYLFQASIPMPTTALPNGAQALSFYSNEVALKGQLVSGAANVATNLATGNIVGAGISTLNMGVSAFQNTLQNQLITASGQSFGNATGWSGSYAEVFTLIIITEVFKNTIANHWYRNGVLYDDYVNENVTTIFTELTENYAVVLLDPATIEATNTNWYITTGGCNELRSIIANPICLRPWYDPFRS